MAIRIAALGLIAGLTVWLWPLGSSTERMLRDYQSRLNRVLDVQHVLTEPRPQVLLTDRAERRDDLSETSISINEALDLGPCGLVPLLAQNNSTLGKVAADSTRLVYSIELIQAAEACQTEDPQVEELLNTLLAFKRQQLPTLTQNVLFASDEFQAFFKAAAPPLGPNEALSFQPMARLVGAVNQGQTEQIEPALNALRKSDAGGRLLNAQAWVVDSLPGLTQQIGSGRCTSDQKVAIEGVFNAVYVGRIQPWLASVIRASRDLETALGQAKVAQPNWQARPISLEQLLTTTRAHAEAWQGLLSKCGTRVQPLSR